MSVYIKGMEMPKNCRECFACKAELSQEKKVIYVCCFAMTDCPLIPVTPHGRLIDADALISRCVDEKGCYYGHESAVIGEAVESAPTVIEAED